MVSHLFKSNRYNYTCTKCITIQDKLLGLWKLFILKSGPEKSLTNLGCASLQWCHVNWAEWRLACVFFIVLHSVRQRERKATASPVSREIWESGFDPWFLFLIYILANKANGLCYQKIDWWFRVDQLKNDIMHI